MVILDFNRTLILQIDASQAVSVVLMQKFTQGRKIIAFVSRTPSRNTWKFISYELEALSVLFGMEKLALYFEHRDFVLQCYNKALTYTYGAGRKLGRVVVLLDGPCA